MRLIEKDSLIKSLYERFVDDEVKICLQEFWHAIEVKECIEGEKEVEAIPKEWILNWAMKSPTGLSADLTPIFEMLEDWEKENDCI